MVFVISKVETSTLNRFVLNFAFVDVLAVTCDRPGILYDIFGMKSL